MFSFCVGFHILSELTVASVSPSRRAGSGIVYDCQYVSDTALLGELQLPGHLPQHVGRLSIVSADRTILVSSVTTLLALAGVNLKLALIPFFFSYS